MAKPGARETGAREIFQLSKSNASYYTGSHLGGSQVRTAVLA